MEAERLEDGETVEVMVPIKRGSRKKDAKKGEKERHPWNFGGTSEEWSASREREDRGRMGERSQGGVVRVGAEFHATAREVE